eukprot:CAMPEP_0118990530 /NCGR_PEP_ID=MMETSP1173-20130426/50112_1 /TAXON_ID=1034831 /ORGANISM="Rhizochromulina marina cf, Strain CCMP1243" /LENGTH=193 /DNA_ID=CAMNT_0006941587 /DNA_START=65 /DNA_END=643 /DNA_ORIENTATION=+
MMPAAMALHGTGSQTAARPWARGSAPPSTTPATGAGSGTGSCERATVSWAVGGKKRVAPLEAVEEGLGAESVVADHASGAQQPLRKKEGEAATVPMATPSADRSRLSCCGANAGNNDMSTFDFGSVVALLLMAGYFAAILLFYMPVEGWSVRQCLYFAVITFTTVGFGDLVPTTPASKLFTCLIALVGASLIG